MTDSLTAHELFDAQSTQLKLQWLAGKSGENRQLEPATAKYPGMALVGHLNFIHPNRVQVIGDSEIEYIDQLSSEERSIAIEKLFSRPQTAVFIAAGVDPAADLLEAADQHKVPFFRSSEPSPLLIESLNYFLSHALAPRVVEHGVFMEVMGIGVLITGESGIGKSELALELLSRNHRLIADDAVEILRGGPDSLIARCLNNRLTEFLEVRGLGIINVRTMFGETAVRHRKQLHFTIRLEKLSAENFAEIDRLQAVQQTHNYLGIDIPEVVLYVAPGRNLAVLLEAATRTHILRMWGMNPIEDFLEKHNDLLNPRST
jgi:HPr kinase/phosphorylase